MTTSTAVINVDNARIQWALLGSGVTDFYSHRIYMREAGDTDWTLAYEEFDATITNHDYALHQFMPGISMEFSVIVVTQPAGLSIVLGAHDDVNAAITSPSTTKFELVDPITTANNLTLNHATGDSFSEEYEAGVMVVIGGGRHVDIGTRIGMKGSLALNFHDVGGGDSARTQRRAIESIRTNRNAVWLRSPFGEAIKVVITGFSFTRTAGVGVNSYGIGTLSYSETP